MRLFLSFVLLISAGAQWYFYFSQGFAGRFYIDTALFYMKYEQSHYFSPYLGIGAELL